MVTCLSLYQRPQAEANYLKRLIQVRVVCRLFLPQAYKLVCTSLMPGLHFDFYNNPYNNDQHAYRPSHVTMFGSLKKKLSRRSSNPMTETNAAHSAKSMGSRSPGLTPPSNNDSFTSAAPATRRPSKHCNQAPCLRCQACLNGQH